MILLDALAGGRPLLADGGMGTALFAMGLVPGDPPESWIERQPGRITAVHRAFVRAGADVILTNTFGANAARLQGAGLATPCRALNAAAARLARGVADRCGRPLVVAGAMGPLGLPPGLTRDAAAMRADFAPQAEGLAEGGADVAWIETVGSAREAWAAAAAAEAAGLPVVVTASFEAAGATREGMRPADLPAAFAGWDAAPLALGANCGAGPASVLLALLRLRAAHAAAPLVAKASAGLPVVTADGLSYPVDHGMMADYARMALDSGARIVGGCCGITPMHVAAMRAALDAHQPQSPPSPEAIAARFGAVSPWGHLAPG